MVSGDATTMTLPAKIVKNKEPITLALTAELTAVLKKQFRQTGQPVFDATNLRREWTSATVAGAPASQAGVLSATVAYTSAKTRARDGHITQPFG